MIYFDTCDQLLVASGSIYRTMQTQSLMYTEILPESSAGRSPDL